MKKIKFMAKLIKLVKPLILELIIAALTGFLGFLCISMIAYLGVIMILEKQIYLHFIYIIIALAVLKGIFKYLEQWFNHYIAFKVLAHLRNIIFQTLQKLALNKLDEKEKGVLISSVTSDIEILEAFYAHSLSPILIAIIYSLFSVIFIGSYNLLIGLVLLISYIIIGGFYPFLNYYINKKNGILLKNEEEKLKNTVVENFEGLKDIKQFKIMKIRNEKINSANLNYENLRKKEKNNSSLINFIIISTEFLSLLFIILILIIQKVEVNPALIIITYSITSYKAVINVAKVASILVYSFASGKRILNLIEEKPIIDEVFEKNDVDFNHIIGKNISFAYQENTVINNLDFKINKGDIVGIRGKSGVGKSTLLRLIMRFYDPNVGKIEVDDINLKDINTANLRKNQSLILQETHLFNMSILDNIKIGRLDASYDDVICAAKLAQIHDDIIKLKKGYETIISKTHNLSKGQRQKISLARSFLSNAKVILLDEPTANLDALNEGMIMKALKDIGKTIIIVSHRKKTLSICNKIINLKEMNL